MKRSTIALGRKHWCGADEWYVRKDGSISWCAPCTRASVQGGRLPRQSGGIIGEIERVMGVVNQVEAGEGLAPPKKTKRWRPAWTRIVRAYWGPGCALSGPPVLPDVIDTAHLKGAEHCTYAEKICGFNGLPMLPTLHRLYDRGYISISDDGWLLISRDLDDALHLLPPTWGRVKLDPRNLPYIRWHRANVFRGEAR